LINHPRVLALHSRNLKPSCSQGRCPIRYRPPFSSPNEFAGEKSAGACAGAITPAVGTRDCATQKKKKANEQRIQNTVYAHLSCDLGLLRKTKSMQTWAENAHGEVFGSSGSIKWIHAS
jgi:hypothetical protein